MKVSNLRLITLPDYCKADSFYASYQRKKHYMGVHWHDFYEIHLITDGAVTEYINGQQYNMQAGWLYFLKPYDVHEYCSEEPFTMYKIQFMIDLLDADIQKILISNKYNLILKLEDEDFQSLEPIFSKIIKEFTSPKSNHMKYIEHMMNCLLIELIRLLKKTDTPSANSDTIVMALDYIHHHYTQNITMQQVAEHVGLTPNYFCSKFHNEIGQSFKQYLRELQLNHAMTLLRISDRSVSDICDECGINSLSHFLKDFKTLYGITPSQYRKQLER